MLLSDFLKLVYGLIYNAQNLQILLLQVNKPCSSSCGFFLFKESNLRRLKIKMVVLVTKLLFLPNFNYGSTYMSKPVDLHSYMNNHITSCRLGGSTGKFDSHIFYCMQNQKHLSFFKC